MRYPLRMRGHNHPSLSVGRLKSLMKIVFLWDALGMQPGAKLPEAFLQRGGGYDPRLIQMQIII
jgi:hypothetical protein